MKRQHGATLAELLVALAVGMGAMLMAAGLLVSANAAYLAQVDAVALDEGGRFALDSVARAVRQAGYVNWEQPGAGAALSAGPARIAGLDARSLPRATSGLDGALAEAVNGSDVLAVHFAGSGAAGGGDGSAVNCAGFGVGEADDGWSIFYVGRDARGEAELRCKYRGAHSWGADAIVAGVDSFQLLYGVDTDEPPDGLANEYLSATALDERGAAAWKRVASIRVALVLHAAHDANAQPRVFDLFGSAYSDAFAGVDRGVRLAKQDLPAALRRRERKLFATTIYLHAPP
ncbi:PilW family protein [Massilia sp. R2A-15]|uniref:PilW family protein n=1 Tax=Massilia sp. R2A-15 TaxID=3064278 RepID=UPI0027341CA1|nr:PilW family protein [Massilia sp. R2A-15]WLI90374.1 PilW family protein [Massilia sp. R2A-15]